MFGRLKGTVSRVFCSSFFVNNLPTSPFKKHQGQFEFFIENSRRYSQVKVHHRWQICQKCQLHLWCTLSCEYLANFRKKYQTALTRYSKAWGKLIYEKNLKPKISQHCPFKAINIPYLIFNLGNSVIKFWYPVKKRQH